MSWSETLRHRSWPIANEELVRTWWDRCHGTNMRHWSVYMRLDGKIVSIVCNDTGAGKDKQILACVVARKLRASDPVRSKKHKGLWFVGECWARSKSQAKLIVSTCVAAFEDTDWLANSEHDVAEIEYISTLRADEEEVWW